MPVAIRAEGLGKRYRLGAIGFNTLRDDVQRFWGRVRGRPQAPDARELWALRDVTFDLDRGQILGVIGRNGAGKSTLLKILSRITAPTCGTARLRGTTGSLLEVGTGFHPDLTGRENVFINGAILGMRRSEVARKFDEIVQFAAVEPFIDTPVKRYSSGMTVRLGFAVAAHLDPEILIIDEVLAVGDAEFQQRCIGKMNNVAREGRTVVFVSHNMGAVARLCTRGLVIARGRTDFWGSAADAVAHYAGSASASPADVSYPRRDDTTIQVLSARLLDAEQRPNADLDRSLPFGVRVEYEVRRPTSGAHIGVMLDLIDGTPVCYANDVDVVENHLIHRAPGRYATTLMFPGALLNAGTYQIRIAVQRYGGELYDYVEPFAFNLHDHGTFATYAAWGRQRPGVLAMQLEWRTQRLPDPELSFATTHTA